jgi:hypothetical protein
MRLVSAFILAGMVPLAVLISRDKLRTYRRGVLIALEDWMYKNAAKKPLPSFDVARIKYELAPRKEDENDDSAQEYSHGLSRGSLMSFFLPAMIYSFFVRTWFCERNVPCSRSSILGCAELLPERHEVLASGHG